jgi:hypothetical protein
MDTPRQALSASTRSPFARTGSQASPDVENIANGGVDGNDALNGIGRFEPPRFTLILSCGLEPVTAACDG